MTLDSRPWVLGIGSSLHNGAACLLHGDEIVAAVQEERLLRLKRADARAGEPSLAVQYCLQTAGIRPSDLSCIGVSRITADDPRDDVRRSTQLQPAAANVPTVVIGHHLGHAIGAFATSGFGDALVLVVDGYGSPRSGLDPRERDCVIRAHGRDDGADACETISMYAASGTVVAPIEKHFGVRVPRPVSGMRPFFSIGSLFLSAGEQIFGEPLDGAGKVMGLAPYGAPTMPVAAFFRTDGDEIVFSDAIPRQFTHDDRWPCRHDEYVDLAASVQRALESAVLWTAARLRARGTSPRLCYAGGVALNSVANERLVRESGFERVYIMPAAEDSGTAIGAAYAALWHLTGRNTCRAVTRDAMGRTYRSSEISRAIELQPAVRAERPSSIVEDAAARLAEGRIIGWFQEGSELGPRALGQRSILADPRRPDVKDVLNARVKFREGFRPYAPVVLLEQARDWFETSDPASPFMLRVMRFAPGCRERVPGVVHVDGTGRVQTVTRAENPLLHGVIDAFHRRTGVPMLLNTSFNTAGEPIVESPEDALLCLLLSGVDACVLDDQVVTRVPDVGSPLDFCPELQVACVNAGPNRRIAAPPVSEWRRPYASLDARRTHTLSRLLASAERPLTVFTIDGPYGPVTHLWDRAVGELLLRLDGRHTGWRILDDMNLDGRRCGAADLAAILAQLARAGAVRFHVPTLTTVAR